MSKLPTLKAHKVSPQSLHAHIKNYPDQCFYKFMPVDLVETTIVKAKQTWQKSRTFAQL